MTKGNQKEVVCAFPIETIARELDSKLYLAIKTLNAGFKSCVLGHKNGVINEVYRGKDSYIFLSKGAHRNEEFYHNIERSGGLYTILDAEGAVFSPYGERFNMRNGMNNPFSYRIQKIFFWGNRAYNKYRDKGEDKSKAVITGNPAFDVSKIKYIPFYRSLTLPKSYILINTAFGSANNILSVEEEVSSWKGSVYEGAGTGYDYLNELLEFEKKLFKPFIAGIKKLAKKLPKENFVLRPHPVENINYYKNEFSDCPNIKIIKEGSVQEWNVNASLVIHPGMCTTAIEAFLQGKDVIAFTPYYDEQHFPDVPYRISVKANATDELINLVRKKIELKRELCSNREEKLSIIKEIIDNVDYDSCNVIVNEFIKLANDISNSQRENVSVNENSLKKILRIYLSPIKRKFKKTIGISPEQKRSFEKFPGLSKKDIIKRIQLFGDCGVDVTSIKVKKIDVDTFKLVKIK